MRFVLKPRGATVLATVNDVILSSVKWHVGHAHGSTALIADAKHSLSDVAMDVGALFTVERSEAVQRAFTIVVCVSLCLVSLSFFKDAVSVSAHSSPSKTVRIVSIVESTVIVTKEAVFRTMRGVSRAENSSALFAAAQHQRADVGISIGAAVGACLMARGFWWADRICAIGIGVVMVDTARRLYISNIRSVCTD